MPLHHVVQHAVHLPNSSCPLPASRLHPGSKSEHAAVLLQWPTRELCPLCMLPSLGSQQDILWNEDEVYRFLVHFYQGSSPQASQDVTGAAAGYKDGGYVGRCEPSAAGLPLMDVRSNSSCRSTLSHVWTMESHTSTRMSMYQTIGPLAAWPACMMVTCAVQEVSGGRPHQLLVHAAPAGWHGGRACGRGRRHACSPERWQPAWQELMTVRAACR